MENHNLKSESEVIEIKTLPLNNKIPIEISKYYPTVIIIFAIILSCITLFLSFLIFFRVSKSHKFNILEKEIEYLKRELNITKEKKIQLENKEKDKMDEQSSSINKEFLFDYNFYLKNSNNQVKNLNSLGYAIIFHCHTLEKGLSHFELRPFGKEKISIIINLLKEELKYETHLNHFSFINGINSLRIYKKTYEEHKWTDKPEYKLVSGFLKDFTNIPVQRTGAYVLTREELEKDFKIDYKKFIKSRHSTRNYKNMELKAEDIKEAIEIAKYTPSACNRQYVKVHYYPKGNLKQNVLEFSVGKGGIYLEGVNTFIITFDVNGLNGIGERNQGYFNAGLFSTNLINAFHSLGIGTCFIQFNNSVKDEEKLKLLNGIPSNERIAVILYAGYYDDKSIFAVSPRKEYEDYFTEHK